MNKPVIDVVLSCEERKNILLFLKSGLQETEFILESLEMSRQDLLPNIRVLEDSVLIARSEDVWELTTIGKLMVGKDSTKVNELVARATSLHLIVLENLNQTAPEQARTSLQKAIEQTEMTRGSTIVALEKKGSSIPDISNGTNISSDFGSNGTNVSSDFGKVEENGSETKIEIPAGKP